MSPIKRFKAPTPAKWRAGGTVWMLSCIALFLADQLQVVPHFIPMPESYKPYVNGAIIFLGILGKLLSGLAVVKPKK